MVIYVAETEQHQLGFASGGAERDSTLGFDSELYTIYLDGGIQGQGVGRQLLQGVASELAERGFQINSGVGAGR